MNHIKTKAVLFFCFFYFVNFSPAYGETSPLSEKPCSSLLGSLKGPDGKTRGKADLDSEFVSMWSEQIEIFRQNHPDLYDENAADLESSGKDYEAVFSFTFQKACMFGGMNTAIGKSIQGYLEYSLDMKSKNKQAQKEDCRVSTGKGAAYFGLSGDPINLCINNKYGSHTLSGPSKEFAEKYKDQKVLQVCFSSSKTNCMIIEGTKEQQCLSTYGECKKLETGDCGWAHTKESLSCAGK